MRFAASEALFPAGGLATQIATDYESQCRLLCYGPYPTWADVQATFLAPACSSLKLPRSSPALSRLDRFMALDPAPASKRHNCITMLQIPPSSPSRLTLSYASAFPAACEPKANTALHQHPKDSKSVCPLRLKNLYAAVPTKETEHQKLASRNWWRNDLKFVGSQIPCRFDSGRAPTFITYAPVCRRQRTPFSCKGRPPRFGGHLATFCHKQPQVHKHRCLVVH